MGSDKDQVGIGVITSDFAARDLGPWCGGRIEDQKAPSFF